MARVSTRSIVIAFKASIKSFWSGMYTVRKLLEGSRFWWDQPYFLREKVSSSFRVAERDGGDGGFRRNGKKEEMNWITHWHWLFRHICVLPRGEDLLNRRSGGVTIVGRHRGDWHIGPRALPVCAKFSGSTWRRNSLTKGWNMASPVNPAFFCIFNPRGAGEGGIFLPRLLSLFYSKQNHPVYRQAKKLLADIIRFRSPVVIQYRNSLSLRHFTLRFGYLHEFSSLLGVNGIRGCENYGNLSVETVTS